VAYRSSVVTPDTAEALRHLETNAAKIGGIRIHFEGVSASEAKWGDIPGPTGYPSNLCMRPSGREVYLRAELLDYDGPESMRRHHEVAAIWGFTVPLGFTPWLRHPVAGDGDTVFHFLGPWQPLYDHLCSEGRGELAWPSICGASQADVGRWGGPKATERFVQAQLHRLGLHCGAVDGHIGERTTSALRALGIEGQTFEELAKTLAKFNTPETDPQERRHGHVLIPGDDVSVVSYGKVATTQTRQGVTLAVDGPGKVIINIGQEI